MEEGQAPSTEQAQSVVEADASVDASPNTKVTTTIEEPPLLSYIFGVVSQQLLEEIGQAKSTEPEENAAIVKELEKLRLDCISLEELVAALGRDYGVLQAAIGGFSEQLYQLGIKEEEKSLQANLTSSGILGRNVAKELNVQSSLNACASSIHQQVRVTRAYSMFH